MIQKHYLCMDLTATQAIQWREGGEKEGKW